MKNLISTLIVLISLLSISCVQKSFKQTVILELDVSEIPNIKTVGVRGENKPLNWDNDLEMKAVKKDSLYTITISGETGYLFTELKFVVNGEFELQNKPNRKVIFNETKTTIYKAKYNKQ